MDLLARLDGVSKIYPRVHRPGERLRGFGAILAGREPSDGAEVLRDVSLDVYRGQGRARCDPDQLARLQQPHGRALGVLEVPQAAD